MTTSATVIVLHSFMFNDTKMIADVLSEAEGRQSVVVRISRSKASRSIRNLFQPLAILELTTEFKHAGQMHTVKEAHIAHAYTSIPFHPYKLSISIFLAEFLSNITRGGQQNDPLLFRYITDSLQWLDETQSNFANFHIVFLIRITRFIGIYPNTDNYASGCCFDLINGCFTSGQYTGKTYLSSQETAVMHKLMRMNYNTMHLFRMSRNERNRCLDAIIQFYRLHIPEFREMKSLAVLRDIMS